MKKNYEMPVVEVVILNDMETSDNSAVINFWGQESLEVF